MINKFIFSGFVIDVNEATNTITYNVPVPNSYGLEMSMVFTKEVVDGVKDSLKQGRVIITVEGLVVPSKDKPLDLSVTSVSTSIVKDVDELTKQLN